MFTLAALLIVLFLVPQKMIPLDYHDEATVFLIAQIEIPSKTVALVPSMAAVVGRDIAYLSWRICWEMGHGMENMR